MASTGNVPTYPRLSSYCACTIAQCVLCLYPLYSGLAWPARAMYLFCPCLYLYCGCTIAQCVLCLYLLYSVLAWPARVSCLYYPCLYSYCACTIAQYVLCLYPLYSVLAWLARAIYLLIRVCARTVLVPLHSVYCACTPCIVVWHGQHGQCTYLARVMYLSYPCLYSYCSCTIALCLHLLHSVLAWEARAMYVSSCLNANAVPVALLIPTRYTDRAMV